MLLCDFDINDYCKDPYEYDKHQCYQRLLCEAWLDDGDEDEGEPFGSFDMYFEIAFVEGDDIQMLKVNASDFMMNMDDLIRNVGYEQSGHCILKFFYEDGSNQSLYTRQEIVPVAYVVERNALYFEAADE